MDVRNNIEERVTELAVYVIEHQATVRAAAAAYGVSKSTVHKDLTERLVRIDPTLYEQVRVILERNKAERHIRGGLATRQKYKEAALNAAVHKIEHPGNATREGDDT